MQGNIIRLNKMMKKIAVVFMTATIFVVLAGCGEEKKDITSIKIDRKGNITSVIYDDFAGENYSQEEFEIGNSARVEAYNEECLGERITVESVEKNEETSKIKVVMTYDSPDDYKKFNGKVLFYGTVKEAEKAGYTLTDKLVDSERKAPDKNILKKYKNKHVIIVEDKTTIFVPYNIDYVSVGARYIGKKGVDLSGCSTQLVEILLSK